MMTASVGNADYHAAAKIADRLLVAASAASQRLTEHRTQSHNADWPAASQ